MRVEGRADDSVNYIFTWNDTEGGDSIRSWGWVVLGGWDGGWGWVGVDRLYLCLSQGLVPSSELAVSWTRPMTVQGARFPFVD